MDVFVFTGVWGKDNGDVFLHSLRNLKDVILSGGSVLDGDFVLHFGTGAKKSSLCLRFEAMAIEAGNSLSLSLFEMEICEHSLWNSAKAFELQNFVPGEVLMSSTKWMNPNWSPLLTARRSHSCGEHWKGVSL